MQNVLLGQTKVMQIRQRETLSHQRAIIHEVCLSSAQWPKHILSTTSAQIFGFLWFMPSLGVPSPWCHPRRKARGVESIALSKSLKIGTEVFLKMHLSFQRSHDFGSFGLLYVVYSFKDFIQWWNGRGGINSNAKSKRLCPIMRLLRFHAAQAPQCAVRA